MNYTLEDIAKQFDKATYEEGLALSQKEAIKQIQLAANLIRSQVKGPSNQVFSQNIFLKSTVQGLKFQGTCTCKDKTNCKHVVSVLLTVLKKKKAQPQALSAPVASWLLRLKQASNVSASTPVTKTEKTPAQKSEYRLLYILSPDQSDRRTFLGLCKARFKPNGEIINAHIVNDPQSLLSDKIDFISEEDKDPIQLFVAMRANTNMPDQSLVEPRGPIGAQLLQMLIEKKQLLWTNSIADIGKALLFPLRAAPKREARLVWIEKDASLRLSWEFAPAAYDEKPSRTKKRIDYILPTEPAWYMDNLTCGELSLPSTNTSIATDNLWDLIFQAPPIPVKDKVAVSRLLITQGLADIIPPPENLKETERRDIKPVPVLRLGSLSQKGAIGSPQAERTTWHDFGQLLFDYDGQTAFYGTTAPLMRASNNTIEKICRDLKKEQTYLTTLKKYGFSEPLDDTFSHANLLGLFTLSSQSDWMQFSSETLSVLEKAGWKIEKNKEYRYDLAVIEDWYAQIVDKPSSLHNDWFSLELGILINKKRVSLLPLLVALIRSAPEEFDPSKLEEKSDQDSLITTLPNGIRIALPWGRIKPILKTLGELYFTDRDESPTIRLHTLDSPRLSELTKALPLNWLNGERLLEIGTRLSDFDGVQKINPPKTLKASLRDYQIEGLSWMQFLREYELAGILADDMGLGKTLQTLSHILLEKEQGRLTKPALVVAPTSLMSNWKEEAERFTPSLKTLVLQGKDRVKYFKHIPQHDLILTTYALLPRDEDILREYEYHLLILDESQYIKNYRSKAAQVATTFHAKHRLCLTGTPLENHLGELWSQFHFLLPGLLGNEKTFNSEFRHPIEKLSDANRQALLAKRIRPFLLRRTKDKVARELPSKTEMIRYVDLTSTQQDIYETVRLAMDKKIREEIAKKGVARSQIVILDALLKLRQVCCDPRLLRGGSHRKAITSAKLSALMEMVDELMLENRRILIFSQFTRMLSLIETELKARKIKYVVLTGDTVDRASVIHAFQEGKVPIFLISLKAGGVGLNLTAADTVIHYDPWWNPAVENQATDRAWRIGQDKPVFVYKLIARGSLEEKIQDLQLKKAELADAILSTGERQGVQITPEDLQSIFEPLARVLEDTDDDFDLHFSASPR